MDDLDRLAFRLVRTVRNSYPHLLAQEFTLTDLEERLLPFRDARREMSNNGPEVWEVNVLRMVSGEREYLKTDADLQLACRQALTLPSPTLALVRPWSATTMRLGASATVLGNDRGVSHAGETYPDSASALDYTSTLRLATPAPLPSGVNTVPRSNSISNHVSQQNNSQSTAAHQNASLHHFLRDEQFPPEISQVEATQLEAAQLAAARTASAQHELRRITPGHTLRTCGCRFCGGKLPDSRKLTFCPHCGVNLTVRQCPACSTELDVNWRFCVTCGRGSDIPELPASVTQIAGSIAI